MENLKTQTNTQNLESDKSAALLTQDEISSFRKLPITERRKKTEAELNEITDLNNELKEVVQKINITGDITNIEEIKKKDKEVKMRIADLQELIEVGNSYEDTKEINKQKISDIYDKCFSPFHAFSRKLSKDDLRFIYEIDFYIRNLYSGDVDKINRIRKKVNKKGIEANISFATGIPEEQISTNIVDSFYQTLTPTDNFLSDGIKIHYGNIDLYMYKTASDFGEKVLPENVAGCLNLSGITSAIGLKLPKSVSGYLDLYSLQSTDGLKLPEHMGGDLKLNCLTSAKGLVLPENMNGGLSLESIKSADDLKLPKNISGSLDLRGLKSANNLKLPDYIGGNLNLSNLESAKDLNLPEIIDGGLLLYGLTSAEDLKLPKHVKRLILNGLVSAVDLKLPEKMDELSLNSLETAIHLKLPEHIDILQLNSLNDASDLKLPENIKELELRGLKSGYGLKLPEHIGKVDLSGIYAANGLKIPEDAGDIILTHILSPDNLILPDKLKGDIYLPNSAEVFSKFIEKFPQHKDKFKAYN